MTNPNKQWPVENIFGRDMKTCRSWLLSTFKLRLISPPVLFILELCILFSLSSSPYSSIPSSSSSSLLHPPSSSCSCQPNGTSSSSSSFSSSRPLKSLCLLCFLLQLLKEKILQLLDICKRKMRKNFGSTCELTSDSSLPICRCLLLADPSPQLWRGRLLCVHPT